MLDEASPVQEDEWLLRICWRDYFKQGKPISNSAFAPRLLNSRSPDVDGISLFRRVCVGDDVRRVLEVVKPDKRELNGIVTIPVSLLLDLGLTVVPMKVDRVPGHVVIPEINANVWTTKQNDLLPKITKIAARATTNVLIYPAGFQP